MLFCHVLTPLKRVSDSLSCLFLCIIRGPARGFHLSLSSQSQTLNFNTEQHSFLFQFLPFPLLKKKKKKNQNPNFLYFPKPQFILYLFAQISSSVQTLKPRETLLILFFFFHSSSCFFSRLQTLFYEINKTQLTTYAYLVSMVLNFTTTERKIVFRTV